MHCADCAPCVHLREEHDEKVPLTAYAKRLAAKAAAKRLAGAASEAMVPCVIGHTSGSDDNEDMQVCCCNSCGIVVCSGLGADVAFRFAATRPIK